MVRVPSTLRTDADAASKGLMLLSNGIVGLTNQIFETLKTIKIQASVTEVDARGTASKVLGEVSKNLATFGNAANVVTGIVRNLFGVVGIAFTIVKDVLQSVVAVFSIIGTLFNVVKAVFEGVITIVKSIVHAVGSIVSTVTSSVTSIVGDSHSKIATFLKYALGAAAVAAAAFVATGIAAEHAWQPLRETLDRISIAGASEKTIGSLRKVADQISHATTTAASNVLELAEKAVRLRVPADSLNAVTTAAIGLSAALGIGQSEALSALNKGLRGNVDALRDYIPQLKGVKDQTQQIAIIQRIANDGFDLAGKKVSTFAGFWTQLKNVMSGNAQRLGEAIAPGIKLIVDALRPLLPMLESSGGAFAALFNGLASIVAPVLGTVVNGLRYFQTAILVIIDNLPKAGNGFQRFAGMVAAASKFVDGAMRAMATGIIAAFTYFQVVAANWGKTWELIKLSVELALRGIADFLVSFFKDTFLPLFDWFLENAKTWLVRLGDGLLVGFKNLFTNLAAAAVIGMRYVKASMFQDVNQFTESAWSMAFSLAWSKNLTEGFKGAWEAMPDVIDQDAEGKLKDRIGGIGKGLGDEFRDKFDQRMKDFNARLAAAAGENPKAAIDGLKKLPKESDDSKKGHAEGNNYIESRLLTRAPGRVNPLVEISKQQLAELRANNVSVKEQQRWAKDMLQQLKDLRAKMFDFNVEPVQ